MIKGLSLRSAVVFLLLTLAGFLGGFFNFPLFFGVHFLFCGIAALVATVLFGPAWGCLAALLASSYSYFIWGHPYFIIVQILEALFVGLLWGRGQKPLLLLDAWFWIAMALPLVAAERVVHQNLNIAALITLKLALNGIFNALIASLLIAYVPWSRVLSAPRIARSNFLAHFFFEVITAIVLLPTFALMALFARLQYDEMKKEVENFLESAAVKASNHLTMHREQHMRSMMMLAQMAGSHPLRPSPHWQMHLGTLRERFPTFDGLVVLNADWRAIAADPRADEQGALIGRRFPDAAKRFASGQRDRTHFYEALEGKTPRLRLTLGCPVLQEGELAGYILGTVTLRSLAELFASSQWGKDLHFSLQDTDGMIIASTRSSLEDPADRTKGLLVPLTPKLNQSIPPGKGQMTPMSVWGKSFFVYKTFIPAAEPWNLVLETSVKPYRDALFAHFIRGLVPGLLVILLTVFFAPVLSRKIARPLTQLAEVTRDLPEKIRGHRPIDWPESQIVEESALIENFKEAGRRIAENLQQVEAAKEDLEIRVRERTAEIERERLFQQMLIDHIPQPVLVIDLDYRIVRSNQAAQDLLDGDSAGFCYQAIFRQASPCAVRPCLMEQVLDSGRLATAVYSFSPPGEEAREYEITASPLSGASGSLIGIVEIYHEITGRVRAEEALKRKSEEQTVLLDNIETQICFFRDAATLGAVNEAYALFLGKEKQGLENRSIYEILSPEEAETWAAENREVFREGRKIRSEHWMRNGRGEDRLLAILKTPKLDEQRRVEYIICAAEDITQRRRDENRLRLDQLQLEELNLKLEEKIREEMEKRGQQEQILIQQSKMAAMGEMIANIAHQWRQPLNVVGLAMQDLEEAYDYGELDREYLNRTVKKGMTLIQHMSRTIDDFRQFFRPGKDKREFSARELIEKTLSLVEESFKNDGIRIEREIRDEPRVNGYANEYAQALLNILMNAREALAERGGENRRIRISLASEGGRSVVTVADNGGGIAPHLLDRIFDPYFTTKEQGKGMGLGLYMSRIIIEKNMGGRLTAANRNEGAEFRIEV